MFRSLQYPRFLVSMKQHVRRGLCPDDYRTTDYGMLSLRFRGALRSDKEIVYPLLDELRDVP